MTVEIPKDLTGLSEIPGWRTRDFPFTYISPSDPQPKEAFLTAGALFPPEGLLAELVLTKRITLDELSLVGQGQAPNLEAAVGWLVTHQVFQGLARDLNDTSRFRNYSDLEVAYLAATFVNQTIKETAPTSISPTHPLYALAEGQGDALTRSTCLALLLFHLGFGEKEGVTVCPAIGEFLVAFGDATGLPGYYHLQDGNARYVAVLGSDANNHQVEIGELPERLPLSRYSLRPVFSLKKC